MLTVRKSLFAVEGAKIAYVLARLQSKNEKLDSINF